MQTILIVDLEATCWNGRPQTVQDMEIIEFGCALASIEGIVTSTFHQLVRPILNPGAGLGAALASVGLKFEGRQHRGEDDAKNIARLLPYLGLSGV